MAVLLNGFILCVWQMSLVLSTGVNLPFTSMSYKATPINPKSLSLSVSAKEGVESKVTNNLEDFKTVKTPQVIRDEELSKNLMPVSKPLYKLGLISDTDSTLKDLNFLKKKHDVDPYMFYDLESPQKNVPNLKSYDNEKSNVPKNLQDTKDAVNYNIKVISPPSVFNNPPLSLPATQNVADNNLKTAKLLSETKKHHKNLPHTSILSYPVRVQSEDGNQESTSFPDVRSAFLKNDYETRSTLENPLVQKNIINIAKHDLQHIQNTVKNEDIVVSPTNNAKFSYDLDIDNTQFKLSTPTNSLFDYNIQIPIKVLDTPYFIKHEISPIVSNAIDNNQEIRPLVSTSSKQKYNVSTYNKIEDKEIPSNTLLSYASKLPYISDISPTLRILSTPTLPEISKPPQIYTSDINNFHLVTSLDNIISFLTSEFNIAFSDISAPNSMLIQAPLRIPQLLQPHVTTDEPVKFSSYPEVESPTYLLNPNVNISINDTDNDTKKSHTKFPVPYVSSVTINYMPCIESLDEIIIIV